MNPKHPPEMPGHPLHQLLVPHLVFGWFSFWTVRCKNMLLSISIQQRIPKENKIFNP